MRARRLVGALCGAGLLLAAPGGAQPTSRGDGTARPSTGSAPQWQFDQCMGGITYGAPLKWALSYGMGLVRESVSSDWCVLVAAKVGFGGASMNVGVANSLGHWGSGIAVTGGLLRTFNDPMGALAKRTYVGGSVHLWPLLALGGEVGVYRRLGSDVAGTTRGRTMITWSTGFGF